MSLTFLCYLHKTGALTPELRVVTCPTVDDLPDILSQALPTWGEFETIDVYDDRDHRLFSFAESPRPVN